MTALLCCRRREMGAALAPAPPTPLPPAQPPTMADLMRERKKKSGGAALGTLRRRIAAARRRDQRPDRGCEHARYIRNIVSPWRLGDVVALCGALEAGAALRDLHTQAGLARAPAPALGAELARLLGGAASDVTLLGAGWALPAHRAILAARSPYFRELLSRCALRRVPLGGAPQQASPDLMRGALHALYGGAPPACALCAAPAPAHGWERDANSDGEPDSIDADTTNTWGGRGGCACARRGAAARRLAAALGCAPHALTRDIQYLLESGEYSDCRLSWGCGGVWAAHRAVLAARSRLLRKAVCGLGGSSGALRVDEAVLPRRFAGALLHAAYTDQLDLGLIEPLAGTVPRRNAAPQLEDAFQLYEIARFVEMPILAQGCEDAIAALLSPATLPRVLRWAAAPHASQWVHRQAMRYLLDEFSTLCGVGSEPLPRSALAEALRSPFLQCSEPQALKALQRWSEQDAEQAEGGAARRGRRRGGGEAAWRGAAGLAALLRLEHVPPDDEQLASAVRRGLPPPPPPPPPADPAAAWLGRPPHRPPRAFLPYLDELKALLAEQPVPAEELAHARRVCCVQRAPDTLYMLQAGGGAGGGEALCVSPRARRALRLRQRELRAAPPAATALALPHADPAAVLQQIALRCVRERGLPDACADLLLAEEPLEPWAGEERAAARQPRLAPRRAPAPTGSLGRRSASPGGCCGARLSAAVPDVAMPPAGALPPHAAHSEYRPYPGGCCGARLSAAVPDVAMPPAGALPPHAAHSEYRPYPGGCCGARLSAAVPDVAMPPAGALPPHAAHSEYRPYPGGCCGARLSAAVPDVAMPPAGALPPHAAHSEYRPYPGGCCGARLSAAVPDVAMPPAGALPPHAAHNFAGAVLQLDLGDGATHTPRPGSRRATPAGTAPPAGPARRLAADVAAVREWRRP